MAGWLLFVTMYSQVTSPFLTALFCIYLDLLQRKKFLAQAKWNHLYKEEYVQNFKNITQTFNLTLMKSCQRKKV